VSSEKVNLLYTPKAGSGCLMCCVQKYSTALSGIVGKVCK
jgi:hypothetical protein